MVRLRPSENDRHTGTRLVGWRDTEVKEEQFCPDCCGCGTYVTRRPEQPLPLLRPSLSRNVREFRSGPSKIISWPRPTTGMFSPLVPGCRRRVYRHTGTRLVDWRDTETTEWTFYPGTVRSGSSRQTSGHPITHLSRIFQDLVRSTEHLQRTMMKKKKKVSLSVPE